MENLKVIPQVFFTLIARLIPGTLLLVNFLILNKESWEDLIREEFGVTIAQNATISFLLFLSASFVIGELISPLAKAVQRLGELGAFKPAEKSDKLYDALRLHNPEVGGLCAKIRAEFTMHNGFSIVFLLTAVGYLFTSYPNKSIAITALVGISVLCAIRGRTVRDTFYETVRKFAKAANMNSG